MLDQEQPQVRQEDRIRRFSVSDRVEHWLQVITFVALAFTGLIQKWPEAGFSQWSIRTVGGIEATRLIHRVFATMLLLAIVYHLFTAGKRIFVDRAPRTMVPGMDDLRAAWGGLLFNIGRRKEMPLQGRFTWEEKLEYWAIVWGTLVMTITGFMLWNPVATATFLPGQFIPAAKAAHGGEALLAVLAILVWHFYHVHLRHFSTTIFTGYISRHEMEKEHPLELAAIEAGEFDPPPIEVSEKRRRRFVPAYLVVAALSLIGIYFFVTFEETAITTIDPPEDVTVFVPAPTPTVPLVTTTAPTGETTSTTEGTTTTTNPAASVSWDSGVGQLFAGSCGACHTGGSGLGGLDLSSYAATLAGGNGGPGIVANEPDESVVYTRQLEGGHPGQFTEEQLALVLEWIELGAPEAPDAAGGGTGEPTWDGVWAAILTDACGACHTGGSGFAGLDISSYRTALAGGNSGPGLVPGDPEGSSIYVRQAAGGHAGQLTDQQVADLRDWIDAGAPEG